jgi:glycosyltransferase involved in cell wall biosynthesis
MRLLYVHERFGTLAGAESNAFITATALKHFGHDIGIIHGLPTGVGQSEWEETFSNRYPLAAADPRATVQRAVREFRPDVIYVHKMADLAVIEELIDSGVPLVRMVHDHDIYCLRSYKYNYFTRKPCTRAAGLYCVIPCGAVIARNRRGGFPLKLVSYLAKKKEIRLNQKFQRMVVVSDFMRDELLKNGFDAKRIEIHAPVPRMGDPSLRSNFSERNLIVYAGQIIRGKGVDVLLRALSKITVPFECVILGDGNHRAYCEKLSTQLGLDGRVRFCGFVVPEKVKEYYRECSAVALSSVWPEPIATVGLEVMRYGLPVVAFDVGGVNNWLIDQANGFLVPWMNSTLFARALEKLLLNKELARTMGERGRQIVNERFAFPDYISSLDRMFAQVVEENRHPATVPSPALPLAAEPSL